MGSQEGHTIGNVLNPVYLDMGLYRGYIGIMEKKMEATILGFRVPGPQRYVK